MAHCLCVILYELNAVNCLPRYTNILNVAKPVFQITPFIYIGFLKAHIFMIIELKAIERKTEAISYF